MIEVLFFVAVLFAVCIYWARRDADIEDACRRHGYIVVNNVGLDFLGPLSGPPWFAFTRGLYSNTVHQTMVAERADGDIFSGNFSAGLLKEFAWSSGPNVSSYSIVGLRLAGPVPRDRIAAWVNALALRNGLRVVLRGHCVYAMFEPGGVTRIVMPWQQRIQLMQAMDCLVAHRFAEATRLCKAQAGVSPWTLWCWLPLLTAAIVGYLVLLVRYPIPVVMIVGLFFFGAMAWAYIRVGSDSDDLKHYLRRRCD